MREKPGPFRAWTWPPSWLAATNRRTPAVAASVACACAASATVRMPVTPAWLVSTNQTEPRCSDPIAARSPGPS